jgi:hypothetical protein
MTASEKSGLVFSMVPSKFLNEPSTSDTTICVTVNFTFECPLSRVHFVAKYFEPGELTDLSIVCLLIVNDEIITTIADKNEAQKRNFFIIKIIKVSTLIKIAVFSAKINYFLSRC